MYNRFVTVTSNYITREMPTVPEDKNGFKTWLNGIFTILSRKVVRANQSFEQKQPTTNKRNYSLALSGTTNMLGRLLFIVPANEMHIAFGISTCIVSIKFRYYSGKIARHRNKVFVSDTRPPKPEKTLENEVKFRTNSRSSSKYQSLFEGR